MQSRTIKSKIRYFRTTPQQADGAFARKLVGQSTDYHEFFKNKALRPFRADKETPMQAVGEFFPIKKTDWLASKN